MCGIVGIWNKHPPRQLAGGGPVDQGLLVRMRDTMTYRGPDGAGIYLDGGVGLGHRRLKIIDLTEAGAQPMTLRQAQGKPDGRYTIVFNGEIYNFRELKEQYLKSWNFRSTSDTEVLLYLLADKGVEALSLLRGMFAFALWDTKKQELLLVRDPFGKKPLYYAVVNGTVLFASEIKALLEYPGLSKELDRAAVAKYFLYEYVPAPATPYAAIRQVPMGSYVRFTQQGEEVKQWWQLDFAPKQSLSFGEAKDQLDYLLQQSVSRRMVADLPAGQAGVPVGVFLSGGLDSTTIAYYMRRVSTEKLHSFSVSFQEPTFDESSYAKRAAEALGTEHHDIPFTVETFHAALGDITSRLDAPLADASLLPTYAVSKLARDHVTVVLDGDGSDELLGGYGLFQAAGVADALRWLPAGVIAGLQQLAAELPTRYHNFSFDFKVKSFLRGLAYERWPRNQVWLGSFSPTELTELLTPEWQCDVLGDLIEPKEMRRLGTFDAVSALLLREYLHNDLLVKLDRAAMLVALEGRTPFLDADLAQFVAQLPVAMKRNKFLLKQVMRDKIPDAIIDRPKKGFGIPLGWWLKGPLHGWAQEVLSEDKLQRGGVINPAVAQRLLQEHRAGKADHRKKLWTLLTWQLWVDHFLA